MDKPTIGQILDVPPRSDVKAIWPDLMKSRQRPIVAMGAQPHYREQVASIAGMMGLPLRMQRPSTPGYPNFHERFAVVRDRLDEFMRYTQADAFDLWRHGIGLGDLYCLPLPPATPLANPLTYLQHLRRVDDFVRYGGSRPLGDLWPRARRTQPKYPRSEFAPQYLRCEWKRYMMDPVAWSSRPYQLYDYMDSLTPMHEVKPVEVMRLNRKIRGAQDTGMPGRRIVGWPHRLEADVDKDIDRWANRH
jgi:hypothetical protein